MSVEDVAVSTEDLGVGVDSEAGFETVVAERSVVPVDGGLSDADVTAASIPQVRASTNNFKHELEVDGG